MKKPLLLLLSIFVVHSLCANEPQAGVQESAAVAPQAGVAINSRAYTEEDFNELVCVKFFEECAGGTGRWHVKSLGVQDFIKQGQVPVSVTITNNSTQPIMVERDPEYAFEWKQATVSVFSPGRFLAHWCGGSAGMLLGCIWWVIGMNDREDALVLIGLAVMGVGFGNMVYAANKLHVGSVQKVTYAKTLLQAGVDITPLYSRSVVLHARALAQLEALILKPAGDVVQPGQTVKKLLFVEKRPVDRSVGVRVMRQDGSLLSKHAIAVSAVGVKK